MNSSKGNARSFPPVEVVVGPPPLVHYGSHPRKPVVLRHPQSHSSFNTAKNSWKLVEYHTDRRHSAPGRRRTTQHPLRLSDEEQTALLDSVKSMLDTAKEDNRRRGDELRQAGNSATKGYSPEVPPRVYNMDPFRTGGRPALFDRTQSEKISSKKSSYSNYAPGKNGKNKYPAAIPGSRYGPKKKHGWNVQEEYWPDTPWPVLPSKPSRQRPGGSGCDCATYNNIGAFAGTTTLILNAVLFVLLSIANGGSIGRELSTAHYSVPPLSPEISHQALYFACNLMGFSEPGDTSAEQLVTLSADDIVGLTELNTTGSILMGDIFHDNLTQLLQLSAFDEILNNSEVNATGFNLDSFSEHQPEQNSDEYEILPNIVDHTDVEDELQDYVEEEFSEGTSLCKDLCIETVNGIFPIGGSFPTIGNGNSTVQGLSNPLVTISNFKPLVPEETVITSNQDTIDTSSGDDNISLPNTVLDDFLGLLELNNMASLVFPSNENVYEDTRPSASVNVSQMDTNYLYEIQNHTIITSDRTNDSIINSLIENLLINANLTLVDSSSDKSTEQDTSTPTNELSPTSQSILTSTAAVMSGIVNSINSIVMTEMTNVDNAGAIERPVITSVETDSNFPQGIFTLPPVSVSVNMGLQQSEEPGNATSVGQEDGLDGSASITSTYPLGFDSNDLNHDEFLSTPQGSESTELPDIPNFLVTVTSTPLVKSTTTTSPDLLTTEQVFSTLGIVEDLDETQYPNGVVGINITPTIPTPQYIDAIKLREPPNVNEISDDLQSSPGPLITAWGDLVTFNDLGFWKPPTRKPIFSLNSSRGKLKPSSVVEKPQNNAPFDSINEQISIPLVSNGAPSIKEGFINSIPISILDSQPHSSLPFQPSRPLSFTGINETMVYGNSNPDELNALFEQLDDRGTPEKVAAQFTYNPNNPLETDDVISVVEHNPDKETQGVDIITSVEVTEPLFINEDTHLATTLKPLRYSTANAVTLPTSNGPTAVPAAHIANSPNDVDHSGQLHMDQVKPVSFNQHGFWKPTRRPISQLLNKLKKEYLKEKQHVNEKLAATSGKIASLEKELNQTGSNPLQLGNNSTDSLLNLLSGLFHEQKVDNTDVHSDASIMPPDSQISDDSNSSPTDSTINQFTQEVPITTGIVKNDASAKPPANIGSSSYEEGKKYAVKPSQVEFNKYGFWKPTKRPYKIFLQKLRQKYNKPTTAAPRPTTAMPPRISYINQPFHPNRPHNYPSSPGFHRRPLGGRKEVSESLHIDGSDQEEDSQDFSQQRPSTKSVGRLSEETDSLLSDAEQKPGRVKRTPNYSAVDEKSQPGNPSPETTPGVLVQSILSNVGRSLKSHSDDMQVALSAARSFQKQFRRGRQFTSRCVTECWLGTVGILGSVGGLAALAIPVYALIATSLGTTAGSSGGSSSSSTASGGGGIVAIGPFIVGDDPNALPVPINDPQPPAPPDLGTGLPPGVPQGDGIAPPAPPTPGALPSGVTPSDFFGADGVFVTGAVEVEQDGDEYEELYGDAADDFYVPSEQLITFQQTTEQQLHASTESPDTTSGSLSDAISGDVTDCDNFKLCMLHSRTPISKRKPPRWYFSTYLYDGSFSELCQQMSERPTERLCRQLFPHCTKNLRPLQE